MSSSVGIVTPKMEKPCSKPPTSFSYIMSNPLLLSIIIHYQPSLTGISRLSPLKKLGWTNLPSVEATTGKMMRIDWTAGDRPIFRESQRKNLGLLSSHFWCQDWECSSIYKHGEISHIKLTHTHIYIYVNISVYVYIHIYELNNWTYPIYDWIFLAGFTMQYSTPVRYGMYKVRLRGKATTI